MTSRAEKVAEAQRLRAQGLYIREIAERMGFAVTTVAAWLSDPDRSREIARKESYRGICVDCGAPTSGSEGRGPNAPKRCLRCGGDVAGRRSQQRAAKHRALIERLWAEGKTSREIGKVVGWEPRYAAHGVAHCRANGYDLPYRYSAERIARMTAGASERMAKARAAVGANRKAAA